MAIVKWCTAFWGVVGNRGAADGGPTRRKLLRRSLHAWMMVCSLGFAATAVAQPNLTITKRAAVGGNDITGIVPGGSYAYLLTANNIAPSNPLGLNDAIGTVTVTDTLPPGVSFVSVTSSFGSGWSCSQAGGTVSCSRTGLGANSSAPLIAINVTAPVSNGQVANTANVACDSCNESNAADNSDSVTITVAPFDMALTLRDSRDPVSEQGIFDYQVSVTNTTASAVPSSQTVTVNLQPPANFEFVELPSGNGWTCNESPFLNLAICSRQGYDGNRSDTLPFTMRASATTGTFSAQASVNPGGSNATNDSQTEQTTVASTDLALEKYADQSSVRIGAPYRYSLYVTNSSSTVADTSNASVVDSLPTGVVLLHAWGVRWQCDEESPQLTCSLDNNGSVPIAVPPNNGASLPIKMDVLATAAAGTVLNTATVSSPADSSPGNNGASNSVTVVSSASATDLQLTNTATGPASIYAGAPYSYVLSAKNAGSVAEPNTVTVKAVVPIVDGNPIVDVVEGAGWACTWDGIDFGVFEMLVTCTRSGLAADTTAPDITIKVLAGRPGTDKVRAWVTGTADTNPQNNVAVATKTIVATSAPDINLIDVSTPAYPTPVQRGADYNYTLRVGNLGPGTATGPLTVIDVLPAGVGFVSANGTNWSCNQSAGTVTCTYSSQVGAGASTFDLTINATAPLVPGLVVNQATVTNPAGDPITSNNSAGALTAVANTLPVANDDSYATAAGQTLDVSVAQGVLANDSDADNDHLTAILGMGTSHGQLTLNADGSFSYIPDANYNGFDQFTYQASDGAFNPNSATVTIAVGNSPPVLADTGFSIAEDQQPGTVVGQLQATDDGIPPPSVLTYSIIDGDPDTVFAMDPSGRITLEGPLDYEMQSTYVLTVQVSDGQLASTAMVTITVTDVVGGPGNENPPVADSQNLTTQRNVPLLITLTASDPDPGASLTYSIVDAPDQGGQLTGLPPDVTYTPPPDFVGTERFTFKANDGAFDSNIATVAITVEPVNAPPQISDQTLPPVAEDAGVGVVVGHVDASDDGLPAVPGALAYSIFAGDPNNQFAISSNGDISVASTLDFEAKSSYGLTVEVSDGQLSSSALVTINVTDVIGGPGIENTPPVANDDAYSTIAGLPMTIGVPGVLGNDVDTDGDALTLQLDADVSHGTLQLNADGSFTYDPVGGFTGIDSFQYHVSDSYVSSNMATVTITVAPAGSGSAPTAGDDAYTVMSGQQLVAAAPGVLDNDTDAEGDTLMSHLVLDGSPSHGTLSFSSDGSFSYTADSGYVGTDSFHYTATDGSTDSNEATVTINVVPVGGGAAPTAQNDDYAAISGVELTIAPLGVLANDSDPEGDPLSASLVDGPTHGTLMFGTDGGFRYTPDAGYEGTDTFTYEASDGSSISNPATVTITVSPPGGGGAQAVDDDYQVANGGVLSVAADTGVLANDQGGPPLVASLFTGPANGVLAFSSDGSFTYTPDVTFTDGTDTFVYSATNDGITTSNATVTITVGNGIVNDVPVALDDAIEVAPGGTATTLVSGGASLLANDTNIDLGPLTASKLTDPTAGTVTVNGDGTFSYTNTNPLATTDSFTYEACDTEPACDTATVTITISAGPVNHAPVAVDDAIQVAAGGTATALVTSDTSVLDNDSDQDGDPLTATLLTGPTAGDLVLNADGTFSYTNTDLLATTDSFSYEACDGFPACDAATVTITIAPTNAAPVAGNDAYTTIQDQPFSIGVPGVLGNDTDSDGDALSAQLVADAGHGHIVLNGDGSFTYQVDSGFVGIDSFTYQTGDGQASSNVATVTINVAPIGGGSAPVAANDMFEAISGQPRVVAQPGVLGNDTDPDGDALLSTFLAGSGPSHGTLSFSSDGSFTYTSDAGYTGPDSFGYFATDGALDSDLAIVSIDVVSAGGGASPTAANDSYDAIAGVPLTIAPRGILANDTDPEGDLLSSHLVAGTSNGTLMFGSDGGFRYTPNAGFTGTDAFTYRASDGASLSNLATVTFNVSGPGSGNALAMGDAYQTANGEVLSIAANTGVLANDQGGPPLLASLVSGPANGVLAFSSDGSFTYTPDAGFTDDVDTFVYSATDDGVSFSTATVTITVGNVLPNNPPVAADDAIQVAPGAAATELVTGQTSVLANDSDLDGDTLTASKLTDPTAGTVTLNADGTFVYTNTDTLATTDSFTYQACDQSDCDAATVTITIGAAPINHAPVVVDDAIQVTEGGTATALVGGASSVLANDSDPDFDALHAIVLTPPSSGSLTLGLDGTFSYTNTEIPSPSTDSFEYRACDEGNLCTTGVVTITITNAPTNRLPIVVDDAIQIQPSRTAITLVGGANSVLANDSDPDGDPLTASKLTDPTAGTLTLNSDGTFSYTNTDPAATSDSFDYEACDNHGACVAGTVTVAISIGPANHLPTAVDDAIQVASGGTTAILVSGDASVLANDSDQDLDPLTASPVMLPSHGTLALSLNGTFSYTNTSGDPATSDSFEYEACDPSGACDAATVTIAIDQSGGNQAPVASDDAYTAISGVQLSIGVPGVLGNDVDADGEPLSVQAIVSNVSHGQLVLNGNGSFTYQSVNGFAGEDSFTYQATDGMAVSNIATVKITVTVAGGGAAPVAANDAFTVVSGQQLVVAAPGVLGNDTDGDGDPLFSMFVAGSGPSHGTLSFSNDGGFTYIPDNGYVGPDSFSYFATDGAMDSEPAAVSIDVVPVGGGNAPVANDDAYDAIAGVELIIAPSGILANDTDAEGDPLSSHLVTGTSHGTLMIGTDGGFRYTPDAGYTGDDAFTYQASDGVSFSNTATVAFAVAAPGSGNVQAVNDAYQVASGEVLSVVAATGVLANDQGGPPLLASLVSGPAHGILALSSDGGFTYAPDADFTDGTDTFIYSATNDGITTSNATVTITVGAGVNHAPVADPQTLATPQDIVLPITLTAIDSDGDALTFEIIDAPSQGGQLTGTPPNVDYHPPSGFNGVETFTFKANDGSLDSNIATVTITVGNGGGGNQAPVAAPQFLVTAQDAPLSITLTAVDPEGAALDYSIVDAPNQGGQLTGVPPNVTYTPGTGFNGVETFTFKANDGSLDSNIATVTITVGDGGAGNQAPVADPQNLVTPQNTPLPITLTATDPDGDALTYEITAQPNQGGQLTGTPPNVMYTPSSDFNGVETFTFKASDGSLDSNVAAVTITVGNGGPGNQAPVAASQDLATPQDVSLPITLTAVDPDNDPLTYQIIGQPNQGGQLTGTPPSVTYTPPAGFNGIETFSFSANDGLADSNVATVTVTVGNGGPGNQAPVAVSQSLATPHDVALSITLTATDPDGDPLNYSIVSLPSQGGQLTGTPPNVTYTPPNGFSGIETFTFIANDGSLDSNVATVTINVGSGGNNQAPVADAQTLSTPQDVVLPITLTATDPEGDTLIYSVVDGPDQGGQLTGTPPNVDYHPPAGFNGMETFSFKANDGALDSNVATVTITVGDGGAGNQAPVANPQDLATPQDTSLSITLTAIDPEGDLLAYSIVSQPDQGGQLTGTPPNVTYTPASGFNGIETFTFKANDGALDSNVATVTVTVGNGGAGNQAPVADTQTLATPFDTSLSITLTATDPDNDPLTYAIVAQPNQGGQLSGTPPNVTYTPASGFDGVETFTFKANDGSLDSNVAIVTIAVGSGGTNTPPVVSDHSFSVAEDAAVDDPVGTVDATDDGLPNPPGALTFAITAGDPDGAFAIDSAGNITVAGGLDFETQPLYTLTVRVSDGPASADATVMITITDVVGGPGVESIPPIVVDDAIQVAPGGTADTLIGDATSVLANDIDLDNNVPLIAHQLTDPSAGTLTFNIDGTFSYTNTDLLATLDSFEYEACDTLGVCTSGVVTITMSNGPLNRLPVAVDDAIEVAPGGTANVLVGDFTSVLDNDSDPDDDALNAVQLMSPDHGVLTFNANGTFTYANDGGDPATDDRFFYEACDVHGACALAEVTIAIAPVLPTITCVLPTQVYEVGDSVSIDLTPLFAPPPGQGLTYGSESLPSSLTVDADLGILSGILASGDEAGSPYPGKLTATTVPGGAIASENVNFVVLPEGEILLRDGFDGDSPQPCQ